eukprot:2984075-Lingulodinium_polyedra.AAC.1
MGHQGCPALPNGGRKGGGSGGHVARGYLGPRAVSQKLATVARAVEVMAFRRAEDGDRDLRSSAAA